MPKQNAIVRFQDLGMKLSLPYNFADDYIEKVLLPYAAITTEVYLAVFWAVSSSARNWKGAATHRDYLKKTDALYKAASAHGIHLNFVANVEMDPRQARLMVDEATLLHERYPGSGFTLRSLETAIALKHDVPDAEISPSTIAFIDSAIKAMYWKHAVNPRVITVAREVNRRPDILRQFKDMGLQVKLIPQDTCIPYCPVMHEHDTAIALRDQLGQASVVPIPLRAGECRPFAMRMKADPDYFWLIANKDVLPGHLKHLKGLVDILKIEGRHANSEVIRRKVEYYVQASSLKSFEIVFYEEPEDAWEKIASCDRNCYSCDWCAKNIRFIGTSMQNLVSPQGHELGKRSLDMDDATQFTIARLEFTAPDGSSSFTLEVSPLESGLSYFTKTAGFGIAYTGKTASYEAEQTITKLAELLKLYEESTDFVLKDLHKIKDELSQSPEYNLRISFNRASIEKNRNK